MAEMRAGILGSIRRQRDAGGHSRHADQRGSGKYYGLEESETSFAASTKYMGSSGGKEENFSCLF